jgi:LPS-assembly lipoprotein
MRLLGLLLVACLLAGCGFQLRGEARLPEAMNETWLQTPDDSSAFVRELSLTLRANGVSISTTQQQGAAQLRIMSERMRRDALTISGRARVREFVLGFEVDFELLDAEGEVLIERETLRMSRDYSFDEQEILAATREEEFLRDEMRRAMAARLLRRLEAL